MTGIVTTRTFKCNLARGVTEIKLKTPLMHQDALADTFCVLMQHENEPVDLTGMAVYGYLLISATRQTIPLTGTASGSTASVTLPSECYALPGYASLVIQLQSGNVRHTVLKVDLCIQRTGSESILYPESASPTLAELLARIDALEKNGGGSSSGGGGTVSPEQVQEAVNAALQEAKESGEFDGQDGTSGTGVVGIKVVEVETQNG